MAEKTRHALPSRRQFLARVASSGLVAFSIVAILLAPIAHRFLHRFHIEIGADRD
ncbi:MAG: hypothetical protein ACRD1P_06765 [Thermoanaerobaculia bacterium]